MRGWLEACLLLLIIPSAPHPTRLAMQHKSGIKLASLPLAMLPVEVQRIILDLACQLPSLQPPAAFVWMEQARQPSHRSLKASMRSSLLYSGVTSFGGFLGYPCSTVLAPSASSSRATPTFPSSRTTPRVR